MSRTIVDISILQTVPPSNLNRDDTGSPKSAVYGGARRARVSSQAWKRATREAFAGVIDEAALGMRTKHVVELVAAQIAALDSELEAERYALAEAVLKVAGINTSAAKKAKGSDIEPVAEAGYLLFLSSLQVKNLARLAVEAKHDDRAVEKSAAKAAADTDHSVDLALFGRMVADAPDLNVDASAQVAHAISVHAVDTEFDFFTAVDDKSAEDNAGAGMLGTVEFNSSTLYRYATVNVNGLQKNLGAEDATVAAVSAFVRTFVTSMPTGKQNTFANRTLPEAVVVSVRESQPINLSGAFEDAVLASDSRGRIAEASARLADYTRELEQAYDQPPVARFVLRVGAQTEALASLGEEVTLDTLLEKLSGVVSERVKTASE